MGPCGTCTLASLQMDRGGGHGNMVPLIVFYLGQQNERIEDVQPEFLAIYLENMIEYV